MFALSIIVFALLMFGVFVDYVTTVREKKQANKNKKILRLQTALNRGQHLLNGRLSLPLTVTSSIVCLERSLAVLDALITLDSSPRRLEVKTDLTKKLANFNSLDDSQAHFYSLLSLPSNLNDQIKMLKNGSLLTMVLKVEQSNGYVSIDAIQDELSQLDILNTRLRASIWGLQATQLLEKMSYKKAQSLGEQAMSLLVSIKCDNEMVTELIDDQITTLQLVNDGIRGVIEEKDHTFYDKFKDEVRQQDEAGDGLHRAVNYEMQM